MNQSEGVNNNENGKELSATDQYPVSFSIFSLARSHRNLASQKLRKVGLFAGQEILLMQLWDQDGQSQNSLGRTLGLDHSTIAKMVRRLEDKGLVTRNRSKEDGRVTLVTLTQGGSDLKTKVLEIWSNLEDVTTEGLTEQEQALFWTLSQKVLSKVEINLDNNKC